MDEANTILSKMKKICNEDGAEQWLFSKLVSGLEKTLEKKEDDGKMLFNKTELNKLREWYNGIEDLNPLYLLRYDNMLYDKIIKAMKEDK